MSKPNGWKAHKLEQLGTIGRGRSRHRPRNEPSLYGGKYPFFQTGDIKAAELYLTEFHQTYNDKGLAQSKLWSPGTVCITIAANIAETAILGIEGCFPDSVVGFVADPNTSDPRFIKYYIDTIKLSMQNVSKGTTQDNLSLEKLQTFDFDAPPLPTQRKIASILSAYDDLIENNTRRIAILEEMAQAIYREWFVNFRFPGHESVKLVDSPLGEIPQGWEVVTLKEMYPTSSGGTPSRKKDEYYKGGTINWVKTKELNDRFLWDTEEKITETGLLKSSAKMYPPYTVIMAMYGATIGQLAILGSEAATNQACCAFRVHDSEYEYPFIFSYLLYNRTDIIGLRSGAAQQNVSQDVIREIELARPPVELVQQFDAVVASMLELIFNRQKANRNLRTTRDLLLPKLISGQLDVEDLDIDVGEPLETLEKATA